MPKRYPFKPLYLFDLRIVSICVKQMEDISSKRKMYLCALVKLLSVVSLQTHCRDNSHYILTFGSNMEVNLATHHLMDIRYGADSIEIIAEYDILRSNTQCDLQLLNIFLLNFFAYLRSTLPWENPQKL